MQQLLMIVDDDEDDIDLFCEAVNEINKAHEKPVASCAIAYGAEDALELLKHIEQPGCIFLDLGIPGISGRQFLMRLKNDPRFSEIPIIIYTTLKQTNEIKRLLRPGSVYYLAKPWSFGELKKNIIEAVKGKYSRVYQSTT